MDQNTREILGSIINGYLQFIKRKWGLSGLNSCKDDININGEIKDGFFYPVKVKDDILEWISVKKGEKNIVYAGRYIISNFEWIKEYSELNNMLEKLVEVYHDMYDHGSFRFYRSKEGFRLTLNNICSNDLCSQEWLGICEGLLLASDTEGSVRKVESEEDSCVFIIEKDHPF